MAAPAFVHLRLHSEYSIVDGTVRIDEAVAAAIADAMPALALTDLGNAFGLVKFYKAARAAGVKPLFGCDVWLTHDAERDPPFRALLLAQSRAGYLRLAEWLTRAYRTNQHRGRAELRREWFDEGTEGLIALSGARDGDVGQRSRRATAPARPRPHATGRRDSRTGTTSRCSARATPTTTRSSPRRSISPASWNCRSSRPIPSNSCARDDFRAHEARVCISEGHVLADPRRPKRFTPDQYFKSQAEMAAAFADLPEALANSVAIAQRCNLDDCRSARITSRNFRPPRA